MERNFFISFLACPDLVCLEMKPECRFLIFWIILLFFYNFFGNALAHVGQKRYPDRKLFFLFFGLSHPGLARNEGRIKFFFFFLINILSYFNFFKKKKIRNALARIKQKWYWEKKNFFYFLSCPGLVCLEMKPELCF